MVSAETLFLEMGRTMVMCQVAEKHMKTFVLYALPNVFSGKTPLEEEKGFSKKTIGMLISELKKRSNLREDFESILRDFHIHRNEFIHNLIHKKDFGLESPNIDITFEFVRKVYKEAVIVVQVFWENIKEWSENSLKLDPILFKNMDLITE